MACQSINLNAYDFLKIFEIRKPFERAIREPIKSFLIRGRISETPKRRKSIQTKTIAAIAGLFDAVIICLIWYGSFGTTIGPINQNAKHAEVSGNDTFGPMNKPGTVSTASPVDYQYTQNGPLMIVTDGRDY